MPKSAPPAADNGAPPIDEAAVALAYAVVRLVNGQPADTAVLALLLALADVLVAATEAKDDTRLRKLLMHQLQICVTRLRDLPPLE